jgi:hypothetical protein
MRGADKSCDREKYQTIVGSFPSSSEVTLRKPEMANDSGKIRSKALQVIPKYAVMKRKPFILKGL